MSHIRRSDAVVRELYPSGEQESLVVAKDNVKDINPVLKKKIRQDRLYRFDIIGPLAKSLGVEVQDTRISDKGKEVNSKRNRSKIGAGLTALGLTVAAYGATQAAPVVIDMFSAPASTDPTDVFPKANPQSTKEVYRIDQTTYYEKTGNVVCHFGGLDNPQIITIGNGEGASNAAVAVKGEGFKLDMSTNCYDSAEMLVVQMNAGNGYAVGATLRAPQTVTMTPWDQWSAEHPTPQS
jgi:hypothetical protein